MANMIDLHLNEPAWPDLEGKADKIIHLPNGTIGLAALSAGMKSGKTSLAFRIDLPDGRIVVAETSLALLHTALAAINARYPE